MCTIFDYNNYNYCNIRKIGNDSGIMDMGCSIFSLKATVSLNIISLRNTRYAIIYNYLQFNNLIITCAMLYKYIGNFNF